MKKKVSRISKHVLLFLAVVGPGLITAVADNDAGGVATYTVAAAVYGMASQYFIILTTVLLAITQDIGARIAIVTGKGLGDLIRERHGARIATAIFILYFFVNQGVVLQNVSGLKAAIQLLALPWPWQVTLVLACALLITLVIKLNYKNLQRIFLVTILFYGSYIISAILVKPNWWESVRQSFFIPHNIPFANPGYWFALVAVLGTTVTAWGQFFVNSYIADKGLKVNQLKEARLEVYIGAIITNLFSWMIAIAVTYTLFIKHVVVSDAFTAALAIKPLAGDLTYGLFAVGLLAASFLGLTIVPLATSYVFTEFFGYERTLNSDFTKGKTFYIFFICQIALGMVVTLFPQISLFKLTIYADYLNAAMLPIIFYFLIKFSEDANIMGEHISKGFSRWFLRIAAVSISLIVIATFLGRVLHIG